MHTVKLAGIHLIAFLGRGKSPDEFGIPERISKSADRKQDLGEGEFGFRGSVCDASPTAPLEE